MARKFATTRDASQLMVRNGMQLARRSNCEPVADSSTNLKRADIVVWSNTDVRPNAEAGLLVRRSASGRQLWTGRMTGNARGDTWLESFQRSLRKLPDHGDYAEDAEHED